MALSEHLKGLPYPLKRLINILIPTLFIFLGFCFGTYTFLHLLFVQRKPSLAFNFDHWKEQSFTNCWLWFGPIAARADIAVVPSIAGLAEGVVLDVGYVMAGRWCLQEINGANEDWI
jgi:hypothetical protein